MKKKTKKNHHVCKEFKKCWIQLLNQQLVNPVYFIK